ncbi:uncharacterized protein METZ01_LOCUS331524, partial [marine metagenome]
RGQIFGTDGIRGRVGGPLVNPDFAACLGTAVGDVLKKQGVTDGEIVIGRDTRKSGAALRDGLTMGLTTAGFSCVDLGVVPTPAVALNTMKCGAVLGVALTASHNPASDNGFKFFQGCGRKVDNAWEGEVESLLEETGGGATVPASLENRHAEAVETYCQFVSSQFPVGLLKGLKIVVDTANGGTSETTPRVLRALGAELLQLGHEPDGFNINDGVGSEYPAAMAECVAAGRADLGLAHDGDGDRLVISDESGHVLEGDEVLGIVALDWIRKGLLAERTVVGTVQCNAGLDATLKKAGGQLVRTEVGDRPVTRRMFEDGLNFGGEPSGHFVFRDCLPTG